MSCRSNPEGRTVQAGAGNGSGRSAAAGKAWYGPHMHRQEAVQACTGLHKCKKVQKTQCSTGTRPPRSGARTPRTRDGESLGGVFPQAPFLGRRKGMFFPNVGV